jgi:hypothetical protein
MDIVCFSDICWDFLWQRHQNILSRFPGNWNILFVEPTSILELIREPSRIFPRRYKNINIVSLPTLPLIDKVAALRTINDNLVLVWLRINFKIKKIALPTLLYYEPRFSSLIGRLNESLVIYDCVDDKLSFSSVPKWMGAYIDRLIGKSNIIIVTSTNLYNNMIKGRENEKNIHLIGNGADVAHFEKAVTDISIPDDIKAFEGPIVGYIGAIDDWMDFDLIEKMAIAYPNISFIFIGPVCINAKDAVNNLCKISNVFFLGKRSYDILPNYIKAFDLCIIPFKINSLTMCVNPVKLYEYLAGGKNVVSTNLPEVDKYNDVIFVAKDSIEFIKYIEKALISKIDLRNLMKIAEENSWDKKTEMVIDLILEESESSRSGVN